MEFQDVLIENFGSVGRIFLPLNTPGMTLITGQNKDAPLADSNGSGKSLILDAICWCLWGVTIRGLTSDEVVRRTAGKDCCVTMNLTDGDVCYRVQRHRKDTRTDKPNDLRLFVDGVEKGKKVKDLQEIINQLIGFDFDTFCVMMPGAGINVAALPDSKIKELLEKLLQTEQLTAAYTAAREQLRNIETSLALQNQTHASITSQLTSLEREVAQLRTLEESFATQKADAVTIRQQRIAELTAELQACNAELQKTDTLTRTRDVFTADANALRQQLVTIEKPAKAQIKLWELEVSKHNTAVHDLRRDITHLEERQKSLLSLSGSCPTCEQAIPEEHVASHSADITEQITELRSVALPKFEKAAQQLRSQIRDLTDETARQLIETQGFLDIKIESIAELQRALDYLQLQAKLKSRILAELSRETSELAKVEAEAEQHNFADIFDTKAKKTYELAQELSKCLTAKCALEKEEKLCKFWIDGFAPSGLRSYMLDYVTPVLNDRAEYYSNVLTAGEMRVIFSTKTTLKNGTEKDKFQIRVEQTHGGDIYKGTSKGEKARADLVIAMALGDLATFRTAKQLPWRFLDEPFDGIDDAGNEAVVKLLNDQKSRYSTVFVITHRPEFKKLFNQRITVVKEKGVSRLENETGSN